MDGQATPTRATAGPELLSKGANPPEHAAAPRCVVVFLLGGYEGQAVKGEDALLYDAVGALLLALELGQQLQQDGVGAADRALGWWDARVAVCVWICCVCHYACVRARLVCGCAVCRARVHECVRACLRGRAHACACVLCGAPLPGAAT